MKSRNIIAFTIFVVLAGIIILFVYIYQTKTNQMVANYVADITVCGNILSEDDCYSRNFCRGIYAPICQTCNQLEFRGCQKVSDHVALQLDQEKTLCQVTGGFWYRNKLGNFCLCDQNGINKKFDQKLGCISK